MDAESRRVVITGLGVISPIGSSKTALMDSLRNRRSGVGFLSVLPPEAVPVRYSGEVRDFTGSIGDFGSISKEVQKNLRKALKVMCRECQMGVAAGQSALNDARIAPGTVDPSRIGVCFGSDYMVSSPEEFIEGFRHARDENGAFRFALWPVKGMPQLFPLWLLKYLPNMPASHLGIYNDLRGPSNSLTLREATPNVCVMDALNTIRYGRADAMLAGSTGTRLSTMKLMHCLQQEELVVTDDQDPATVSRPFDKNRRGMVLGEGAGAVLLEELSHARSRGATLYAEVLAACSVAAIAGNGVSDLRQAVRLALTEVLKQAGLDPARVDFVVANGLSTRTADREEALGIADVFGPGSVPVVAPKSFFGNLGAGSGMVELIIGVLSLLEGSLFPTLNCDTPDPDCPVRVARDGGIPAGDIFVNLSFNSQGQASAAVIRRFSTD
ncbi:MAG: beta-ketoacyl-[acyl-carrier-protein] synthase family protein [Thermogutta sp.]|nr:beta-ketoacyl-[acyl-carrier-protein] synthase family protein [Thermogutta sp.]